MRHLSTGGASRHATSPTRGMRASFPPAPLFPGCWTSRRRAPATAARSASFKGVVHPIAVITILVARICIAAASSRAEPKRWNYDVQVSADGSVLQVDARFPSGSSTELSVESGTEPFVGEV